MKRSSPFASDCCAALIDQSRSQYKVLAQAQAELAGLMAHFADARRSKDNQYIASRCAEGLDAHYKAREFAAREISMAVTLWSRCRNVARNELQRAT